MIDLNLPMEQRLNLRLYGSVRDHLNAHLLPTATWEERKAEMPKPCLDVVTGDAFYCGCEGIGWSEETGWYLLLWVPDDPPPESFRPVEDTGLSVSVDVVHPSKQSGQYSLLFMEKHASFVFGQNIPD